MWCCLKRCFLELTIILKMWYCLIKRIIRDRGKILTFCHWLDHISQTHWHNRPAGFSYLTTTTQRPRLSVCTSNCDIMWVRRTLTYTQVVLHNLHTLCTHTLGLCTVWAQPLLHTEQNQDQCPPHHSPAYRLKITRKSVLASSTLRFTLHRSQICK